MKNDYPVVFIHRGAQQYLQDVLRLAERYNENVVLLGTKDAKAFCGKWVDIDSLENDYLINFKKNFENYSPNTCDFEFGCFARFFYLLTYMETEKLDAVILSDSDNLLYYNLSNMDFAGHDVALSGSLQEIYFEQASLSMWRYKDLREFIEYLCSMYANRRDKLEKYSGFLMKNCGGQGISDMVLMKMWVNEYQIKVLRLCNYEENPLIVDHNVNEKEKICKYNRFQKKKVITFKKNIPYFIINGKEKRAISIHCQGMAKEMIYCYTRYRSSSFWWLVIKIVRKLHIIPYCR